METQEGAISLSRELLATLECPWCQMTRLYIETCQGGLTAKLGDQQQYHMHEIYSFTMQPCCIQLVHPGNAQDLQCKKVGCHAQRSGHEHLRGVCCTYSQHAPCRRLMYMEESLAAFLAQLVAVARRQSINTRTSIMVKCHLPLQHSFPIYFSACVKEEKAGIPCARLRC